MMPNKNKKHHLMSAAIGLYQYLIRLLCGLDIGPLEDLPLMPVDMRQFDYRLGRPGRDQRLAGESSTACRQASLRAT